ncbi:MAG: 50S ribosomal protein L5 [Planctomycetota bacterium]|jgi:large subunit ribosomal protein L5|nr:50S ribosomal protein L5 [Planctomycetota bacterium]
MNIRLLEKYRKVVLPAMQGDFGRSNPHDLPKLEKICLNMGVGKAIDDSKILDEAVKTMTVIAGQAAVVTKARVSVSNFRLRQGYKIGCRVTLRGAMMYEFFDRLISTAIPRIRDFRGVSKRAFDKAGNYSLGVEEVTIFPEVDADRLVHPLGMDVVFVIRNSRGRDESLKFLKMMGMPFAE